MTRGPTHSKPANEWGTRHIAKFLDSLVGRTDVEVIVPGLPNALCRVLEQVRFCAAASSALLGQHAPCEAEFQRLYGRRQRPLWRLADQKMNVFGHHHVADDHPLVTLPNLFQHFHEQVAARGAGQPGLSPVTTKCEEVQIVSSLPALQAPRHDRRLKEPLSSRCDLAHIVEVTDDKNPQVSKTARPGPRCPPIEGDKFKHIDFSHD